MLSPDFQFKILTRRDSKHGRDFDIFVVLRYV